MKYSAIINSTTEIVRLSRAVLFHEYFGDEALTLATEERLLHDTLVNGKILLQNTKLMVNPELLISF